ncbi:hypothetical protein [Flagellimonas sp. CMM7]|uniref:hypothetical protein n=1 Tax=Flagellimonas sp. CMM7 TaxID=2654676 RepID=UPI0013CF603B|nr:hypothetical protein [Flagellimonas sp. CMM7]UII80047.1 hypothetical protein LV704_00650 [Flagellimonas sp. CMM7]
MDRRTDFTDYKFRCSSLGKLMTTSRSKTEVLSKTTQTYLKQLHTEEVFNRRFEIKSKYLDKGIMVEEESITLYSKVKNELFIKNTERYTNEFITGEPDNIDGKIRDIKSSWSFETFPLHANDIPNKDYYYQLQGYMALTDIKEAELIYCLVNTPDLLIEDEKRRSSWKLGFLELPVDLAMEIENNMRFEDIPEQMRVKVFEVKRDDAVIDSIYERVELCRDYLNDLSIELLEKIPLAI